MPALDLLCDPDRRAWSRCRWLLGAAGRPLPAACGTPLSSAVRPAAASAADAAAARRLRSGAPVHGRAVDRALDDSEIADDGPWRPFIDRDDATTRRGRFALEGDEDTRGAVARTHGVEHRRRFGVLWPMSSYREVVHRSRLPVHDGTVVGLGVKRGCAVQDLARPSFTGLAAVPARPLQPPPHTTSCKCSMR